MDKQQNPQKRRRNYFIKKEFQAEFVLKFAMLVMIGSAVSALILYALSANAITTCFENSRLILKSTAEFMLPAIAISALISTVLVSIATAGIAIFMSHRIAGPMYRLEQLIKSVATGNLKVKAQFRHNDEIKIIAESFNLMTDNMQKTMTSFKEEEKALEGCIARLKELSATKIQDEECKKIISEAENYAKRLDEILLFFKTK